MPSAARTTITTIEAHPDEEIATSKAASLVDC